MNKKNFKIVNTVILIFLFGVSSIAQVEMSDIKGRWNLEVNVDNQILPSWLEITKSGHKTLVGRFVYAFGSARPISQVHLKGDQFTFSIPAQWESGDMDMSFTGSIKDDKLKGTMRYVDGKSYQWTGIRSPQLPFTSNATWGEPIALFNGKDLTGWSVKENNQWVVEDGLLKNLQAGGNLVTNTTFSDFKLHVEFRYPAGSNSGIYLRGRYEVQIEDNVDMDPSSILFAGIYGFLTPNEMVAKNPGEWQQFDIELIGRRVSITANGKAVIVDQNIPGITGGALDSRESDPGPIFIQGDHGPIEFRKVVLTPRVDP